MTKRVLTEEVAGLMTTAVAKGNTYERAKTNAVDALVALGILSTDMISPKGKDSKSTADPELFAQINTAIVAGFSPKVQALVNAPSAKGMTDAQKLARRNAQMQIGAKRNDFKTALAKRENAEASGNTSRTRSDEQRIADNLNDCLKVIGKSEGIDGVDLPTLTDHIKSAVKELAGVKH